MNFEDLNITANNPKESERVTGVQIHQADDGTITITQEYHVIMPDPERLRQFDRVQQERYEQERARLLRATELAEKLVCVVAFAVPLLIIITLILVFVFR